MWNWFNCRVSGRHEYGVSCEPGAVFLRCVHCKTRSSGWAVDSNGERRQPVEPQPARPVRAAAVVRPSRVATRLEFPPNRIQDGQAAPLPRAAEEQAPSARVLPFVRKRQSHTAPTELRQAG
jgi:hypothetical protein